MGIVDGLGYEELGQAGSQVSNAWTTGSITSESNISGANVYATTAMQTVTATATSVYGTTVVSGATVKGGNIVASTALSGASLLGPLTGGITQGIIGSNTGVILQIPAATIISGGMWAAIASGAALNVAAAAASELQPVGIVLSNVASGATATILKQGIYYPICEGTIAAGLGVAVGAGTALNAVVGLASGTAATQGKVGTALNTQASGTAAKIPVLIQL